jgi:nucleoside-diphosphate-sugar epimerase
MRILVTGADGYIGAVLVPTLVGRGHEVCGLDAGFYRDGMLYGDPEAGPASATRDTRDVTPDELRGLDAVIHLAELSNDPLGQHDPRVTYELNHHGSVSLARACKAAGVPRFVYSSSCSVYGTSADSVRTERSTPDPQTAYAHCKVLVERDLVAMADDAFSPVILRNATAYGPSPRMRFDIVLNNLAGLAWTTGRIAMTSDGSPWRPLVHVADIARAMACAAEAPAAQVHAETFNVGDDRENYRVREIADIVGEAIPGCDITFGDSGGDTRSYRVSFDKIQAGLPGFACAHDARCGARELVDIFAAIGMTREAFEFRAFTRLTQLRHLLQTGQLDAGLRWTAGRDTTAAHAPMAVGASARAASAATAPPDTRAIAA